MLGHEQVEVPLLLLVPTGMHEIKTPTNIAWISPNVHATQNLIKLVLLSVLQGDATPTGVSITRIIKGSDKSKRQDTKPYYDSCCRYYIMTQ